MELGTLIIKVQEKLGAVINRPKLTEKLLSKPPFKYLFDIISAVISKTGFGGGLYNDQESNFDFTNEEKQRKLDYLNKIFHFVEICHVR